jgi:hypothetical protein
MGALLTEARDLMLIDQRPENADFWSFAGHTAFPATIEPWTSEAAEHIFLHSFLTLMCERGDL